MRIETHERRRATRAGRRALVGCGIALALTSALGCRAPRTADEGAAGVASDSRALDGESSRDSARPASDAAGVDVGAHDGAPFGAGSRGAWELRNNESASPGATSARASWPSAEWPAGEWSGRDSNLGHYWVEWRVIGDWEDEGEFPLNEDFELAVRVFDASRTLRPNDVDLLVTARMPTHGHGMKHDTLATPQADGSWLVTGVLLHMTGPWELYFDLRRGARTERAQYDFELE